MRQALGAQRFEVLRIEGGLRRHRIASFFSPSLTAARGHRNLRSDSRGSGRRRRAGRHDAPVPQPPGIFVLDDGMGLVAERLEHIPNSDPPAVRVISDNPLYPAYERTADEIRIIGRIRWFAREI